mmetsp:Transcript_88451/g.249275  ORF Transcript_88451/g.249275 Transcript_88451/m.249275 type:complete len:89 (-) Transcript_88451:1354-1620(-)
MRGGGATLPAPSPQRLVNLPNSIRPGASPRKQRSPRSPAECVDPWDLRCFQPQLSAVRDRPETVVDWRRRPEGVHKKTSVHAPPERLR